MLPNSLLEVSTLEFRRSLISILILAITGMLVDVSAVADVRVRTDKQTVIIKGNLKSIEILPSKGGNVSRTKPKRPPKRKVVSKPKRPPGPTTLRVGPNAPYKKPSHAIKIARDGDTIEIAAGIYEDCAVLRASDVTIRGVGGRAHLRDVSCGGKGILITMGDNTVVENMEFSGMYVRDGNGAGIRHHGAGLIVRNSFFHDGQQGILSGGGKTKFKDEIVVEDSEFARLGEGGQAHGIYIGGSKKLTVRRSFLHSCRNQGHCLKSRAKHNVITCNVIASLEGNSSYEIDLPSGGLAEIRNNVIEQGPKSVNYGIVTFAVEARRHSRRNPEMSLFFEGNTVINDHSKGVLFKILRFEKTKIVSRNNRLIGVPKPDFGENDKRFPSRRMANLEPYPALAKACDK